MLEEIEESDTLFSQELTVQTTLDFPTSNTLS